VVAVIAGLLTALVWALATLSAARASRILGPLPAIGWVMLIGALFSIPLLALDEPPPRIEPGNLAWLGVAGLGYVVGMVLGFSALAAGKIPVVAPILSTEGAIAATIAILAGEAAGLPFIVMLGVLTGGVFLTALEPGVRVDVTRREDRRTAALSAAAALAFGIGLFASGHASASFPLTWVAAVGRFAGVALITMPLAITRRLRFERAALPFLLFSGAVEVLGMLTFAWGARESIAVTAILAAQFAVLAAVIAHRLGERISTRQWVGVVVVAIGVTAVTILRL
jgi:drug/metabolite transporter (DMT)-like permease